MRAHRFDDAPLQAGGFGARMRAVGASPRLTMGLTVSLLLLLVPLVALVIMAAVGNRDGGAYALVGLVAACGVYATYDGWRQSAQAVGLAEFARVNGLRYVRSSMASQYAGSLFALSRRRPGSAADPSASTASQLPTTMPPSPVWPTPATTGTSQAPACRAATTTG